MEFATLLKILLVAAPVIWAVVLYLVVRGGAEHEFRRAGYKVIPETADETFEFAGQPNYEPLRKRMQQLRDDELARLV